jgi:hypothetical protein
MVNNILALLRLAVRLLLRLIRFLRERFAPQRGALRGPPPFMLDARMRHGVPVNWQRRSRPGPKPAAVGNGRSH